MKKIIPVIFIVFLFTNVFANETNVSINNENVIFTDQVPVIVDGRTLVPIRAVFEHIGFTVAWEEETQTVTLTRGEDIVQISVGKAEFLSNGETFELDVPALIINGRTLLPIRAVLESVGYSVGWNAGTSTVLVTGEMPEITQITIPSRRLTQAEISLWISNYNALGAVNEFENEVVRLINIERAAENLPPLEADITLMMSARFKAQSMYDLNYFNHTNPIYGEPFNIAREIFKVPPNPTRILAENLATGHRNPESVVLGWMESGGHRENIMNPNYNRVGVGFYNNRWAQIFSN